MIGNSPDDARDALPLCCQAWLTESSRALRHPPVARDRAKRPTTAAGAAQGRVTEPIADRRTP